MKDVIEGRDVGKRLLLAVLPYETKSCDRTDQYGIMSDIRNGMFFKSRNITLQLSANENLPKETTLIG
jgi:hypothetical protein